MIEEPETGRLFRRPLDAPRLEALALRYVERYATSREKLARYLRRKLLERGWSNEIPPDIDSLVEKMSRLGYVDDASYAESRGRSLARRGYGKRRISQALAADGIAEDLRTGVTDDVDALAAALALARRRRIGPFADTPPDRDKVQKAIGILLRAGHEFTLARRVAEARSESEFEDFE